MTSEMSIIASTITTVIAGIVIFEYKRRRSTGDTRSEAEAAIGEGWWWTRVSKIVARARMLDGSMVRIQGELRGIAREAKELSAAPPSEVDDPIVEQLEALAMMVDEAERDVTESQLQDFGYNMSRDESVDKIGEIKDIAETIEEDLNEM